MPSGVPDTLPDVSPGCEKEFWPQWLSTFPMNGLTRLPRSEPRASRGRRGRRSVLTHLLLVVKPSPPAPTRSNTPALDRDVVRPGGGILTAPHLHLVIIDGAFAHTFPHFCGALTVPPKAATACFGPTYSGTTPDRQRSVEWILGEVENTNRSSFDSVSSVPKAVAV